MISFLMEGMNGFKLVFEISHGGVIAISAIAVAIILGFYALRSIGLYVLAKRQEVKHAFLAFIPYAWLYLACKIIGNLRTFGSTFAKLAWVFLLFFAMSEVMTLVYNVLVYYPLVGNVLIGGKTIFIVEDVEEFLRSEVGYQQYWTGENILYNNSFAWPYSPAQEAIIRKTTDVIFYSSLVFDIASIIVTVHVYIALFRKFWPQHYVLATILSFFGLFAPFVFAIRKKDPIKYSDYLRQRYNTYYGPYGPYGYYGNPYGRPPYGANPNPNEQRPPEHPFSEFAERGEVDPGEPFDEFNEKKSESFREYDDKNKDE